jgi:hypothetical protein
MNDGLFQLLFIGVLVLASVLDASTRKRRRQQRMERRERAEADAAGDSTRDDATMMPQGTGQAERERTADSMVPADLWEILTGEKRAPTREEPAPAPAAEAGPQAPVEPERAWSFDDRVEETYEPPPTLEPSFEKEPEEAPPEEPRPWAAELEIRRSAQLAAPSAAAMGASLVEPAPPLRHASTARPVRRPAASVYAELLRSGGPDSLRTAIVVSEVLGPPAALRRDGGWERS